jgi:hypothetical protein
LAIPYVRKKEERRKIIYFYLEHVTYEPEEKKTVIVNF